MRKTTRLIPIALSLVLVMAGSVPALAQDGKIGTEMRVGETVIIWRPEGDYGGALLTVVAPDGEIEQIEFERLRWPTVQAVDDEGNPLPDGVYKYELMLIPEDMAVPPADFDTGKRGVEAWEGVTEATILSGTFSVLEGEFVTQDVVEDQDVEGADGPNAPEDQVILDDLIVDGSLCVGFDCVNGESFGSDTIRLKENNLRIGFQDTSNSASFPTNDWQITINDSTNGGQNKFSIDDLSGGRTPFTIEASAPSHSLYVDDGGRLGLGTSTPVADIHILSGNTPTVRLHQDGSSGFAAQTFDVAANEANFFIRDATNGSTLPFRLVPGARTDSLRIEGDGDIGLGTSSPRARLHVDAVGAPDDSDLLLVYDGSATETDLLALTTAGNLFLAGSLTELSDANAKENFSAVDGKEVLARLTGVPISTWNYKADGEGVLHMGPMAQDFYAAFGLGVDERHIAPLDANGVSLAGLQELARLVGAQEAMIEELEQENDELGQRLAALEALVEQLLATQAADHE